MTLDIRTVTPDVYATDNYVVADLETDTSHGDFGHPVHPDNGIVLACWKVGRGHPLYMLTGGVMSADWGNEYAQRGLVDAVETADLFVAHNAKYELGWLERCGLRKVPAVFCTKIAEYVLMGNLAAGDELNAPRGTSLDECCQRRGWAAKDPVVDIMIKDGINPVRIPQSWLEGRCRQDVDSTEMLFKDQLRDLTETNRLGVVLTRCVLTPVLAKMEMVGMQLDAERVEAAYVDHVERLRVLEAEMAGITKGINWKSATQVAWFLYNSPVAKPKFYETEEGEWPVWLVPNRNGRLVEVAENDPKFEKMCLYLAGKVPEAGLGKERCLEIVKEGLGRAMTMPGLGFAELRKHNGEPKRNAKSKQFPMGQPLTDQKTIDALVATTDAQRAFVQCRKALGKVNAALTKSLYFYQGVCKEHDGVFHAEINQTKTATHRTSSTGIPLVFKMYETSEGENSAKSAQFQNLPNAFKPLFKARKPGRLIAEADGSQLEFRTAAQVSGDEQMIADVLDVTFDAHVTSAAAMKQIPYEELKARYDAKEPEAAKWRKAAKPDTFGPLYGKSFGSPEQVRWIEEFRRRYHGFYTFSEANVRRVLADKVLVLPWGMRYYWPFAKQQRSGGYVNCRTAVYNYPIQGFATAEIIPVAVAAFAQRIREAELAGIIQAGDIVILNTVHDSIICDIAESALQAWKEIARAAFTVDVYAYLRNVYHYEFNRVPLGVGMNYGTHWADPSNTEEEYDVFPDGRIIKRK
jgi:DNA polymerase I-like protein with 3'-5' exonuclease and polymerase domains